MKEMKRTRHPGIKAFLLSVAYLSFLTLHGTIAAQQPSDTILPGPVNYELIQLLIKNSIDSIRVANGLGALQTDSSLYFAAADQANYLLNQRWIGHQQPSSRKATVQKRVEYYGGKSYLCGENIAASYISDLMADKDGRRYRNITYRQIACEFVRLWNDSPGHHNNIINKYYSYTGVAVTFNRKTHRAVAVQVFGYRKPLD